MTRVILVRHTEVARMWVGRCYGHSDVGLSRDGHLAARALAVTLAAEAPDVIVHSGLRRAAVLAAMVGRLVGVTPTIDCDWKERNFGVWEGRTWQSIWRETGDAMDGMLTDPNSFRPGRGETTSELIARSASALGKVKEGGTTIVISHGGPIAAVRWMACSTQMSTLPRYVPRNGDVEVMTERELYRVKQARGR